MKPALCRWYAEHARARAASVDDDAERAQWLDLSLQWERFATQIEQLRLQAARRRFRVRLTDLAPLRPRNPGDKLRF